jgi:hypothetical protein
MLLEEKEREGFYHNCDIFVYKRKTNVSNITRKPFIMLSDYVFQIPICIRVRSLKINQHIVIVR